MSNVIPFGKRSVLSKQQADLLFTRECLCVSGHDVMSALHTRELLNERSVNYVLNNKKSVGTLWNVFSVSNKEQLYYLTYKGFLEAVGYYNVMQEILNERCVANDTGAGE